MTTQLFEGLIRLDSTLQPQPLLAKSWQISPDGKTYTFLLRRDVYFQPHQAFGGKPRRCTAQDFVYSFQRVLDPKTASKGRWIFSGKVTAFEAPSDSVLVIRLEKPFAPFLGLLSTPYAFVVPREVVELYGEDFGTHPVGTGTFKLFRWEEKNRLVLHRHRYDPALRYPIDAVEVSFITNKLSAFVAFVQGKLDFLNGVDNSYKDEILRKDGTVMPEYAARYQVQLLPQLNTEYLAINTNAKIPLPVRQAMAYAIDREAIVTHLLNGMGYAANSGMIPLAMPGFDSLAVRGYSYSPEKARQILAAAGYANRNPLEGYALHFTNNTQQLGEFLQQSFEKVGIKLKIQLQDGAALRKLAAEGKPVFWRASWIADYADGENYMALFYQPNIPPNGPNVTRFGNAELNALYETALRTPDMAQRQRLCQRMDSIVMAELPAIPLYYDRIIRLVQRNIRGISPNGMNALFLDKVEKLPA